MQIFCAEFYQYRTKNGENASSISVRTSEQYSFRGTDVIETQAFPTVLYADLNRVTLISVKKCGKYGRNLLAHFLPSLIRGQ